MVCCGWITTLVTLLAVASVVAVLNLPIFSWTDGSAEAWQTLWYYTTKDDQGENTTHVADSNCREYAVFFQVTEAGLIISGAAGVVALVLVILSNCKIPLCCLRVVSMPLVTISFLISIVCVALLSVGYWRGYCQGDAELSDEFASFKNRGFEFDTGFYLAAVACAMFFLSNVTHCCF